MSVSLSTLIMPKRPRIMAAGSEFVSHFLSRQPTAEDHTLGNGLRVAAEPSGGDLACVGVYSSTGSRHETKATNGVSHMMQKAMWMGTQSKSADQLKQALKNIGGQLSFNTGREMQSVTIQCQKEHVAQAIDLLGEVTQRPKLDAAAVDAARGQVIEAMKDWENSLPDQIVQNLHKTAYDTTSESPGAGLGLDPYGSGDVVKRVSAEEIQAFHNAHMLNSKNVVLVASGGVNTDEVFKKAEETFGGMQQGSDQVIDKRYVGGHSRVGYGKPRAPYANHVSLAWEICPKYHQDSVPLQLLMEVFGQYDRFQHDLVSNYGIRGTYERNASQFGCGALEEVRPVMSQYADTGLMGFYFIHGHGPNHEEGHYFMQRLQVEFIKYSMRLEKAQVDSGKNLLKSKLLMQVDSAKQSSDVLGHQLLFAGRPIPLEDLYTRIDNLSVQQVSDTINHYYYDREPVLATWGIYHLQPLFYYCRRSMYRWRY